MCPDPSKLAAYLLNYRGKRERGVMSGAGLQKISYILLLVLLFGVSSGWIGGM